MLTNFPDRSEAVLSDILERRASQTPDKEYAIFPEETWTYRVAAERAWSVANGLRDLGVSEGDYVSVWLESGPEAFATWFGINAAGGVFAPLHLAYRGSLLQHALNLAGSRVLIMHYKLVDRLADIRLDHLETVVLVGGDADVPSGLRVVRWEEVLASNPTRPRLARPREVWDDMALIYTSGTTGPSKGVRISYMHHFAYNAYLFPPQVGAQDRFFLHHPFSHTAATNAIYAFMLRGGSLAVNPGFTTRGYWDDVRKYRPTVAAIPAAMANMLYNEPARPDDADHTLRLARQGPLLPHYKEFSDRFGVKLYAVYGSTEVPIALRSMDPPPGSCGQPVDPVAYEVRLVDEHDIEVPRGAPGEMVVRHHLPWVLNSGYKDMPEATARAWRNGWYHTGDIARRDEEGNFYLVDRDKDTVRRRGENISSVEVEDEIRQHPAVYDVAVVGVKSAEFQEEEVKAVVVVKPGSTLDPTTLIEFLVPRLPYFMVPRYLEYADALPRTEIWKVRKEVLRQAGVTANTWDREAAGIRLRREKL